MKTNSIRISLLALAAAALFLTGPQLAASQDMPLAPISSELKSAPFEKRDDFTTSIKEAAAQIDQRISDLQAAQAGRTPGEALTRAREDLKAARADLDDRISALTHATAETWNTVRDQTLGSLLRVHEAYRKASEG